MSRCADSPEVRWRRHDFAIATVQAVANQPVVLQRVSLWAGLSIKGDCPCFCAGNVLRGARRPCGVPRMSLLNSILQGSHAVIHRR